MSEPKLNFFDRVLVYIEVAKRTLLSREGREYLFGVGKENNERVRSLNLEALKRFNHQYPEVHVYGSVTEFDGGVQYLRDGIVQVCQLREGYEIEGTYRQLESEQNVSEVSKFHVSEGNTRQIPNTFIHYRNFLDYIGFYSRSLNIVLADLWLHDYFPELFETREPPRKKEFEIHEDRIGMLEFMSLIASAARKGVIPVRKGHDFLSLEREDMLLAVSRVLCFEGIKSTLHEEGLNFSFAAEKHFFWKQDIYNNDGEGIEFWCRVLHHKMKCCFDIYEDKPRFPPIFESLQGS